MGQGQWLTIGQVAERLGVSVGTARSYVDAGVFPSARRLRRGDRPVWRRVWSEDVDEYLRANGARSEPDQPQPTPDTPRDDLISMVRSGQWLPVAVVAALLRYDRSTIYRKIRAGKIRCRPGRRGQECHPEDVLRLLPDDA